MTVPPLQSGVVQVRHWYEYVGVGVPLQVPVVTETLDLTVGVPLTAGATEFTGAVPATCAVADEYADALPPEFVAVTFTRM